MDGEKKLTSTIGNDGLITLLDYKKENYKNKTTQIICLVLMDKTDSNIDNIDNDGMIILVEDRGGKLQK